MQERAAKREPLFQAGDAPMLKGRETLDLPIGVTFSDRHVGKPYRARARIDGVRVWLGMFATPEEAAEAIARAEGSEG